MASKIVVCTCNGCAEVDSRDAAERLGKLPALASLRSLDCARIFEPKQIVQHVLAGASGVLILGCEVGSLYGIGSSYEVERRIRMVQLLLLQSGLAPDRVMARWLGKDEWGQSGREIVSMMSAMGLLAVPILS